MATEFGLAGVIAIWNKLDKNIKKKLEAHKNICKEAAEAYERQAKEAEETPQEGLRKQQEGQPITLNLP
jgi:predicted secreted Zn-dependent protease